MYDIICIQCGKSEKKKNKNQKYCSIQCQAEQTKTAKINDWLNGKIDGTKKGNRLIRSVRKYLIERAGNKCSSCGWDKINPKSGSSPLEINHIDGNSDNNRPENLEVLCPNCHSLTPTWKALNRGNGNRNRLRYSKLI